MRFPVVIGDAPGAAAAPVGSGGAGGRAALPEFRVDAGLCCVNKFKVEREEGRERGRRAGAGGRWRQASAARSPISEGKL